ncbi:MAG: tetratricopeptide repeat protein [Pseudomonadota bacterium]
MNQFLRPSINFLVWALCLAVAGCAGKPVQQAAKNSPVVTANVQKRDNGGVTVREGEIPRLYALAVSAMRQNRDAEAEQALRNILQIQPEHPGPYANLAILYKKQGRLEDAERVLVEALARSPARVEYLNMLGVVKRQQGQFAAAAEAYERALAIDGNFSDAHYNLGILCDLYLGDYAKATQHYERFLQLSADQNSNKDVRVWLDDLKKRMHASGD